MLLTYLLSSNDMQTLEASEVNEVCVYHVIVEGSGIGVDE